MDNKVYVKIDDTLVTKPEVLSMNADGFIMNIVSMDRVYAPDFSKVNIVSITHDILSASRVIEDRSSVDFDGLWQLLRRLQTYGAELPLINFPCDLPFTSGMTEMMNSHLWSYVCRYNVKPDVVLENNEYHNVLADTYGAGITDDNIKTSKYLNDKYEFSIKYRCALDLYKLIQASEEMATINIHQYITDLMKINEELRAEGKGYNVLEYINLGSLNKLNVRELEFAAGLLDAIGYNGPIVIEVNYKDLSNINERISEIKQYLNRRG